jgi:hypothetical protein
MAGRKRTAVDACYREIEEAVLKRQRAPVRNNNLTSQLVREGRIRIDLYGKNYRVATLLKGEHAGKSTLTPPHHGKPWKTLTAETVSPTTLYERKYAARQGDRTPKPPEVHVGAWTVDQNGVLSREVTSL